MKICVISKYLVMSTQGANPRWHRLVKKFQKYGFSDRLITSDSNHASAYRVQQGHDFDTIDVENLNYLILKTQQYTRTASIARVISWFAFDFRLFRYCSHMAPDVVVISSLSLTSIIFGIYLKRRHGSRLVFEVRDIWPLTMCEEGASANGTRLPSICGLLNYGDTGAPI